jgi:type I restriction enzyme, S subunit
MKNIPKGWKEVSVTDILNNSIKFPIRMGPFGSQLTIDELVDDGIFVMGIEHVLGKKFDDNGRKFITEEKFKQLIGFQIAPGDVLMTMMGTIGRTIVVPEGIRKTIISSHLLKITVAKNIYPHYIALVLSHLSPIYKDILSRAQGAIMNGLNTKIIRDTHFPIPENYDEQVRIVELVNKQLIQYQQLKEMCVKQLEAVETLPQSLLRETLLFEQ